MSKAFTKLTKLRFGVGGSNDFEIKVEIHYNYEKGRPQTRDDPPEGPEVEIKTVRFRHEDYNGRLYWIDLPDWMMEYINASEELREELFTHAEE